MATTLSIRERFKSAPVAWISKKIHRVTRSALGAEAIALSGTVDRLLWIRLLWDWLSNSEVGWGKPEEVLAKARQAALVTDCKSAYDLLTRTALRTTVRRTSNHHRMPPNSRKTSGKLCGEVGNFKCPAGGLSHEKHGQYKFEREFEKRSVLFV